MKNEEHNLQKACVTWFRAQYKSLMIFAIPNGGARSAVTGAMLKAEGVLAGIPDLFIPVPRGKYAGLFIEMKTPKGVVSTIQKSRIAELRTLGYRVDICRDFYQFVGIVEDYLHP